MWNLLFDSHVDLASEPSLDSVSLPRLMALVGELTYCGNFLSTLLSLFHLRTYILVFFFALFHGL